MNVIKEIQRINEKESRLELNSNSDSSWHARYKDSAYVFCGGLDFGLTEGDIITVFSQYGEIVDINLVRDKSTGKSKGYAFLCYEDQRSTILAVDNFNGIKLCGRIIRVDHVANYKHKKEDEEELKKMEERQKERKEQLSEKEKHKIEKKAKKLQKEKEKLEKEREKLQKEREKEKEKEARKLEKIKSQAEADLQKIAEGYNRLEIANNPYSEMNMNGKYALFNHFKDKEGEGEAVDESTSSVPKRKLTDLSEKDLKDNNIEVDTTASKKLKTVGKLAWDKTGKIAKVKVPLNPVAALVAVNAASTTSKGGPSDGLTNTEMDALRASLGLKPLKQ